MKKNSVLLSLLLLASCWQAPDQNISEEQQVINAVLQGYFSSHEIINVIQNTDPIININGIKRFFESNEIVHDSLIFTDYAQKNEIFIQLDPDQMIEEARVISNEEMDTLWARHPFPDSWGEFYDIYPGFFGYLEFTRPGFDPNGDMALIEFTWYGGYLSSERFAVFLKKLSSGRWVVLRYFYS